MDKTGILDPNLDIKELSDNIDIYGAGNVILLKKHIIKLFMPSFLLLLAVIFEILLLHIIHKHIVAGHKIIFWIISIIYLCISFLWYFYASRYIHKKIKEYKKSKIKYYETVKDTKKNKKYFLKFFKFSLFNFVTHFIILLTNIAVLFLSPDFQGLGIRIIIEILLVDILFLVFLHGVLYRIIEYELSFCICTKSGFSVYTQHGFFWNESMQISAGTIKIIKSYRKRLFGYLFKIGSLCIYTDGNFTIKGKQELNINLVPTPSELAKKINFIIFQNENQETK